MTFADSAAFMQDSIFERGGSDATWLAGGVGGGVPCKIIRAQPDQTAGFGEQRAVVAVSMFKVRKSQVAAPAADDTVTIAGETFTIIGTPLLDKHRLVWSCEAAES